jgi:RimJ/RimL family protein N-acetyltransferase
VRLETERLILRRPDLADVDGYYAMSSDPEVVRWLGSGVGTREQTAARLERFVAHWDRYDIGLCTVVRKEDERVIGRVGFLLWDTSRWAHSLSEELREPMETELGWALAREFWGRGYATEAALAARDWAFEERRLPKLISLIKVGNTRSQRVATKLGMEVERIVERNHGGTTEVWARER